MTRTFAIIVLLFVPALASGQQGQQSSVVKRGEEVFAATCTGYCHGPKGIAGGAPRLADRGFDEQYIRTVVTSGLPGTPMRAWGTILPLADLAAVIAYVGSLNGITPSASPELSVELCEYCGAESSAPVLPPEAARGREMFSDATQGFGRCSTCHQVNGIGIPVVPAITTVPAGIAALRAMATPHVSTAARNGDTFPALLVMQARGEMKLYDLTKPPPVLRTFLPSEVNLSKGSTWRHTLVLGAYSDAELQSILAFLHEVIPTK